MRMNNQTLRCLFMIFFVIQLPRVPAQEETDPYTVQDSIFIMNDFFDHDQPAEITLIFNVKKYQQNKYINKYIPAELIYYMGDSLIEKHNNLKIKARGTSRKEVCLFPPIRLKVSGKGIPTNLPPELKFVKIVTHCKGSKTNLNYMMKEFLTYKIYNIISPYSFHVRLLKMKYIDTGRKNKVTETWAFMLEPEAMLAGRMDMIPVKLDHLGFLHTDIIWASYMTMFQYMIGNTDFSLAGRHNIKLLKSNDPLSVSLIPVPYDFDYSGIVNASYAVPREELGLKSITERYFLGPCRSIDDYLAVINMLQAKKEEIYNLINSFEYLPESERKTVIKYLDGFYNNSYDSRYIEKYILSTCQN